MKKLLSLLLIFVLLFFAVACNKKAEDDAISKIAEEEVKNTINLEDFKFLVRESALMIGEDSVVLMGYGNYEISFWTAHENIQKSMRGKSEKPSNDDILESADKWLSENHALTRDDLKNNYDTITQQYADIISANIEDSAALAIKEKYEEFYLNYSKLYIAVTIPSGTLEDFTQKVEELGSELISNISVITALAK